MRAPVWVLVGVLALMLASRSKVVQSTLVRGLRNNNPGNLRFIASNPWNGQTGDDGEGYGVYSSMFWGVRAAGKQLLKYSDRGLRTVRQIVSTWAPSNENDTAAYIRAVSNALGVSPDAPLDVRARLPEIATAIFRHELGALPFAAAGELTQANIREWVYA